MGAGVRLTGDVPFVRQLRELVPGQFQVNLLDLRWEGIPLGATISDVASDLRIGFQDCPNRLDLSFGLRRRLPGHERSNLFP